MKLNVQAQLQLRQEKLSVDGDDSGRSGNSWQAVMREATAVLSLLGHSVHRRPFLISLGLFVFQQLCGITFIYFYLEGIFIKANTNLDSGLSAALVGLAQVRKKILPPFPEYQDIIFFLDKEEEEIRLIFSI